MFLDSFFARNLWKSNFYALKHAWMNHTLHWPKETRLFLNDIIGRYGTITNFYSNLWHIGFLLDIKEIYYPIYHTIENSD